MHDTSSALIFERSIARTAGLLTGSIMLTGVCWYFFTHGILQFAWEAWLLGMLLGPVAVVIHLVSFFRGGPQVVFDENGIHDFRTSWGLISWGEMRSVEIVTYYASPHLCIHLVNEPERTASLSIWGRLAVGVNHVAGYPALMIRFIGLTPGMMEAEEYIHTHHPEKVMTLSTSNALRVIRAHDLPDRTTH